MRPPIITGRQLKSILSMKARIIILPMFLSNIGAHYNFADVLVKQGRIDQAIEQFREAARIKPSSFKALNNLGVHLEKQLKHDEAIHFYRLALQIEPNNPGLHF